MKCPSGVRLSFVILLASLLAAIAVPSAWPWGCTGHQIIALIAEKHLNAHARAMVMEILAASPIDPALRRYCRDTGLDAFVDSATWADDERSIDPKTGGWHFIDIPRGAPKGDVAEYCPQSTGCVTKAITDELAVLRNSSASAQARADALRYVIHFVGDLHQPLHTTTNDDRGGNCVPVTFFDQAPEETNSVREDYRPNLHAVWDTAIIERWARGQSPQQLADELQKKFKTQIPVWESQPVDIDAWAWESHEVAENVVYGDLPNKVAVEKPQEAHTCADDDHISTRMLKLNERIGEKYESAAEAAVQQQLAKAGARLAAVLNSVWPADVKRVSLGGGNSRNTTP
jgi:S1/P1 Nuclease